MMRLLVLTMTVLVSVSEAGRAARMSSIWDVILGTDSHTGEKHEALASNVVQTHQSTAKALRQKNQKPETESETSSSKSQRFKPPTVASNGGKRKMLINLMDVYHCPTTGVFPIDGDCERFLMCRGSGKTDKIKGKVYRCPKGYLFSGFGARCQPEASVACHRNNPLSRLLERHVGHHRAKFFLMP